nr:alkaline phosphatase family protein [Frankia sp. Cppng1_Ct_nod]
MSRISPRWAAAVGMTGLLAAAVAGGVAAAGPAAATDSRSGNGPERHVLLLSVDGLHQSDLAWYAAQHPGSALAQLIHGGTEFTRAVTPVPSDSFPGLLAQVTGGNPATTGVYYDDTYNHQLLPAGTTSCAGAKPGTEVNYTEGLDRDPTSIDAGAHLSGLPGGILALTATPQTLINPALLPVDPTTCKPVYPHSYLKVNTVFEVARAAGLRTAWSDKHPVYEIVNGPSGTGVQDLFTPEINSVALGFGSGDWTKDNAATQQYDSYKLQAVLNEIDGYDHSRTTKVGIPAIFGMNFQTVSTAQKLPTSDNLTGGYLPGGVTPGPLLTRALDYVDASITAIMDEIHRRGLTGSTTIILSAKHGQSPTDPAALTRVDDGPVIDGLNTAWTAGHPGAAPLVAFAVDDDVLQFWLSDTSPAATAFARTFLLTHPVTGKAIDGTPRTLAASGLTAVYAGDGAAGFFGTAPGDPRHPDVVGVVTHGVVFTGGTGKIAEHGGLDPQDRDVPLVVSGAGVEHREVNGHQVETTQIAPTILALLGLDPNALKAVRIEHTRALPLT